MKISCKLFQESYRRWVCSTFIPYFATQSELKVVPKEGEDAAETATTISADEAQSMTGKAINIDSKAQKVFMKKESNAIKRWVRSYVTMRRSLIAQNCFHFRSRRKADRTKQKRIRIRPCLSVCQTVEQICPYMLPADRAPAYPTQYAGEPTFLCLGKCTNTQQVKSLTRYSHHHCH